MLVFEGGAQLASPVTPAHEFKLFDVVITEAIWKDNNERHRLVETFARRVCLIACAALNARCNMIIHFGVDDGGRVRGVAVESYGLVSILAIP